MKAVALDPWALNTVWESVCGQLLSWDKSKQTFPYVIYIQTSKYGGEIK